MILWLWSSTYHVQTREDSWVGVSLLNRTARSGSYLRKHHERTIIAKSAKWYQSFRTSAGPICSGWWSGGRSEASNGLLSFSCQKYAADFARRSFACPNLDNDWYNTCAVWPWLGHVDLCEGDDCRSARHVQHSIWKDCQDHRIAQNWNPHGLEWL